jgi:hypothetical protein
MWTFFSAEKRRNLSIAPAPRILSAPPPPHLHRDWAHPCHICIGTGLTPARICAGTGLAPAHICAGTGLAPAHICAGTGLAPAHICIRDWAHPLPTSAPGRGSPLPTSASGTGLIPCPHLRRDGARTVQVVEALKARPLPRGHELKVVEDDVLHVVHVHLRVRPRPGRAHGGPRDGLAVRLFVCLVRWIVCLRIACYRRLGQGLD